MVGKEVLFVFFFGVGFFGMVIKLFDFIFFINFVLKYFLYIFSGLYVCVFVYV